MYRRSLSDFLLEEGSKYPIITIVGPRQSGKTTLARTLFPDFTYHSFEDPDLRQTVVQDPRGFFARGASEKADQSLILDEIQKAPEVLSYLQTLVDQPNNKRRFILTGSHNFLLMEKVSQTLAGRTLLTTLLPLSYEELPSPKTDLDLLMFSGGYPRIYQQDLNPSSWLMEYLHTYVERDVRALINVTQLDLFDRFIRLCAGRVGQLVNFSSLANDCGISQPTANAWLSLLKTSYLCFTLQPHFKNFNKRIIKSPKLYFYDTGLLCYLLKIKNKEMLADHPFRGPIFENWIISEKMKQAYHQGEEPSLYFWRDLTGREIDLLIDQGTYLDAIEIKSSSTFHPSFTDHLDYFLKLQDQSKAKGSCYYTGQESFDFKNFKINSWKNQIRG